MLAQHLVDLDVGADRAVLLQLPDVDDVGAGRVVDGAQAVVAEEVDPVAHDGIVGDAALKDGTPAVASADLAEEIDPGREPAVRSLPRRSRSR